LARAMIVSAVSPGSGAGIWAGRETVVSDTPRA
jgi:hypothetical protein